MIRGNTKLASIKTLLKSLKKPKSERENSATETAAAIQASKLCNHGRSQSVEKILFRRRAPSAEYFEKDSTSRCHIQSKTQTNFKMFNIPLQHLLKSTSDLKPSIEIAVAFNKVLKVANEENPENSVEKIRLILKLLDLIATEDKHYTKEMKLITEELNKAIFANKRDIKSDILEESLDKHWDALKDLTEEIPYFYIYDIAVKLNKEKEKTAKQYKYREKAMKEEFERKCKEKDETILTLKSEIDIFRMKLEKLEYEAKGYVNERISLENQLSKNFKKIMDLNAVIERQEDIIHDDEKIKIELQAKLKKIQGAAEEMELKLKSVTQQNEEYRSQYNNLADSFKTLLAKLKFAYKENQDFEAIISNLEIQNSELSIRAAAGFEDLTPRPNLTPAFESLEVEIPSGTTQDKAQALCIFIKKNKEKKYESSKKKGRSTPNVKHKYRLSVLSSVNEEDIKKSVLNSSRMSSSNS
ncbi:unnamed protein product [Blepharisma stoltei]|uniref:Uncharacterized protein n=1 Tax=Blepharisma stoltei TaxID=1481888 RepID=A0AAU9I4N2_9CILI|nr:unnamed protein product [Blepharisma stoltei]